ncbi:FMN-dependent NADH-azoreductase [Amycolatopsis bartoniae]|uniref:FMN dependent NADH:quinone oxidoreductase n=1 Tax=Amycolatopsis bartoniae TaxID=941986 RepID=A0A8H9IVF4_9PSEU|nr:NAD(P)H-dependent oxidoreductase [Amycolatopsis bartoniae]MBB2934326.1 FMN-dependent NADH-azoreductase [Amycolatopsis bartoniae]TVT00119.1 FMN-dependent NADH-azoreductase [Amycolatopsis bartoniae]GHF48162.1 FMN-dependent NADH-azoreductase [Amycolatopsis bartoniae]
MPHLLHIDSSIQGESSVTRKLTARAAAAWRKAHPDGTVTYRDLAAEPLPHFGAESDAARKVPPAERTDQHAAAFAVMEEVVNDVKRADTILLGLPLYNYGPPSTVKAWVDHLIVPGLSVDMENNAGLLGGRELLVLAARGGGYGEGTPREGWDHASPWLPHGLALTGLEPRFIVAELTLASVNPAMAELIPLAEQSLAAAEREIDGLWAPAIA